MHTYVKCPNGHYYVDSEDSCPYCGAPNTETKEVENTDETSVYPYLLAGFNPRSGIIYNVNRPPKPNDTVRVIVNDKRGFRVKGFHVASFAFLSAYTRKMYEDWYNWFVEVPLGEKDGFVDRVEFPGEKEYVIPREIIYNDKVCYVTEIETGAFAFCKLEKIVIPNTVTYIRENAFFRCEGLRELIIPDSVHTIEDYAIQECPDLQSITWRGKTYQRETKEPMCFPNVIQHSKDKDAEMATMKFEVKHIQFYPEDLAKMETMSHKEKMDYAKKLKKQHRYIELDYF